jgi:hypothetical protein
MAVMYGCGLAACTGLAGKLGTPGTAVSGSVGASMRAGLQAAWASGTVRAVLLVTIAMNTLFFPYQHMLPVFARDVLAVRPARARRAGRRRRPRRPDRRVGDRLPAAGVWTTALSSAPR